MKSQEDNRKEKLETTYVISGITADVAQLNRAYLRGDSKGVRRNVVQIINKLEKIRKRI